MYDYPEELKGLLIEKLPANRLFLDVNLTD